MISGTLFCIIKRIDKSIRVMKMDYFRRKTCRLQKFDYSSPNVYFITICTQNRKQVFWKRVGASIARPDDVVLSDYGKAVEMALCDIPLHYPCISIDKHVIMPNHIHLLLRITETEAGRPMVAPTVGRVIQQFKGVVTKRIGKPIWQKLYYDHVVRSEDDYRTICEYIENNPVKWMLDKYYVE